MSRLHYAFLTLSFVLLSACTETKIDSRAVYMLLDTSGTYAQQFEKANGIIKYLLAKLSTGDALALARIDSGSFSEKDIIAKITFDLRPSKANAQKRAFYTAVNEYGENIRNSSYTDITGGLLQAIEYLNETGAADKTILIFSDLKEEIKEGHVRDFPIQFNGIRVIALNVTKLKSDNVDPREYLERIAAWKKRVEDGGGSWEVINDFDHLENIVK